MLSPKQLGIMARERRESQNLSQKEIAQRLSVSQTTLHKMETGIIDTSKHWPRLFTLLGLPLEHLDPIYAQLTSRVEKTARLMAEGTVSINQPAAGGRVKVQVEREAVVIAGTRYSTVQTPEGPAILITWIGRNGETVDGLLDVSMIPAALARWLELARQHGIDPAKL